MAATINQGLFTSTTPEWATPDGLFQELDQEFHFTLDPCANPSNHKTPEYYDLDDGWSGLALPWEGNVFVNPPYGRRIGEWIKKAYESSQMGATVVCLLPSRTDTHWWHEYCMKGEITFIRGRVYFNGITKGRAPFPSAIVVFRSS